MNSRKLTNETRKQKKKTIIYTIHGGLQSGLIVKKNAKDR